MIAAVFGDASLAGWDGFGLAIQAYQKRAGEVIDYVDELARRQNRRMMLRLVKGAYWDTEIKRAQERGLDGYPVFTRKAMTDLNYIACAQKLLALRPRIFPQFATHNALTVATIFELAATAAASSSSGCTAWARRSMRNCARIAPSWPAAPMRRSAATATCSPIWCGGCWRTAPTPPSSRWPPIESVPVAALLRRPAEIIGTPDHARHPKIALPRDLFQPERVNSRGVEFGERAALTALVTEVAAETVPGQGSVIDATPEQANAAVAAARAGFCAGAGRRRASGRGCWRARPTCWNSGGAHFIALLQREGGKTLDDALSEVREAIDFCRYYAAQGRKLFGDGEAMPGPTGESNVLRLRGRGVFVAISPWNFPLAIFLGQVTAALMAGNSRGGKAGRADAVDRGGSRETAA